MEIFIAAVLTGLGLLLGMFLIWQGYHPSEVSTSPPEGSGSNGRSVSKNKE